MITVEDLAEILNEEISEEFVDLVKDAVYSKGIPVDMDCEDMVDILRNIVELINELPT